MWKIRFKLIEHDTDDNNYPTESTLYEDYCVGKTPEEAANNIIDELRDDNRLKDVLEFQHLTNICDSIYCKTGWLELVTEHPEFISTTKTNFDFGKFKPWNDLVDEYGQLSEKEKDDKIKKKLLKKEEQELRELKRLKMKYE